MKMAESWFNMKINTNTSATVRDMMRLREAQAQVMEIEKEIILRKYTFPSKPSPDGYYHLSAKDLTKRNGRRSFSAKTLDELRDKVYAFEQGIKQSASITFKQVFEQVEQEKINNVKNKEKLYSKQNTVKRDYSEYKRFFENTPIELKPIDEITKLDIHQCILDNLNRYDLKSKGFSSLKAILNSIFTKAKYYGYISSNPYDEVDLTSFKHMLVDEVSIKDRVHSPEDIQRMVKYLNEYQAKKPSYIPAYALEFQILTGFRRGEIPPLRWDDIEGNIIHVWQEQITVKKTEYQPAHFVIVEHTKTHSDRYFPIYNDLQPVIQKLDYVHQRLYPNSRYLFPAKNTNGVITNNTVYNFYRRMCKKLGIEISKEFIKGTHAFRRNAITDIINICGSAELASELLGNSPKVALQHYYSGINTDKALEILNQRNISS